MNELDIARIEKLPGQTMLVFDDVQLADEYVLHLAMRGMHGMVCRVEDTRTGSGLVVQWRDPIASTDLPRKQREALWLLEEVLAGRVQRPERGTVTNISDAVEARRLAALKEK